MSLGFLKIFGYFEKRRTRSFQRAIDQGNRAIIDLTAGTYLVVREFDSN